MCAHPTFCSFCLHHSSAYIHPLSLWVGMAGWRVLRCVYIRTMMEVFFVLFNFDRTTIAVRIHHAHWNIDWISSYNVALIAVLVYCSFSSEFYPVSLQNPFGFDFLCTFVLKSDDGDGLLIHNKYQQCQQMYCTWKQVFIFYAVASIVRGFSEWSHVKRVASRRQAPFVMTAENLNRFQSIKIKTGISSKPITKFNPTFYSFD